MFDLQARLIFQEEETFFIKIWLLETIFCSHFLHNL